MMRWLYTLALVLLAIAAIGRLFFNGSLGFSRLELDAFAKPFFAESPDRTAPFELKGGLPRALNWSGKVVLIGHGHLGFKVLAQQANIPEEVRASSPRTVTAICFVDLVEHVKEGSSSAYQRTGWSVELYLFDWKKKALIAQVPWKRYGPEKEARAIEKSLPDVYGFIKKWKAR